VTGYGGLPIVLGVSLSAPAGQLTLVIGPNGSGKSTTMRAIAGLLPSDKGRVQLTGQEGSVDLSGFSPRERLARGLAFVPQERTGFPHMSVADNLALGGWLWRRDRRELNRRIQTTLEALPQLRDWRDRQFGALSGGQQKLAEVGRALVSAPKVLILDEPTAGVSPAVTDQLLETLRSLATERSVSVLMVEQNLESALRAADYAFCLVGGRNDQDGPAAEIEADLKGIVARWLADSSAAEQAS
jgi:branched-chain amino acid transport system ATP-binding protein